MFFTTNKIVLQFIAGWLFWGLAQVVVLHRLGVGWTFAVIDSAVFALVLALCCITALMIYRYYQPGTANRIYRLIFAFIISIAGCGIFEWLMPAFFIQDTSYHQFLEDSMPVRFVFMLLLISFVSILSWLLNTLKEQKHHERQKNENEQLLKEAELIKLRQQLQPHFLFNSLNSISALAGSDAGKTRTMIQQLSDFLRGTLKKDEQQLVRLRDELAHIGLYLEIEKVRFGQRLNIEIGCEEACYDMKIPPLILQPLVENAIKFGLYGTIDNITVSIEASCSDDLLQILIANPFDVETSTTQGGTGFGLSSVERRLFLLYSRNDLLHVEKTGDRYFTRLKIPQP